MIIRHSAIYLLARGVPGLINFLALPLLTRLLTPDVYGAYALAIVAISFGNAVFFQWIQISLLRFAQRADTPRPVLIATAKDLLIKSLVVCGLIVVAGFVWLERDDLGFVLLTYAATVACGWCELTLQLFSGTLRPGRYGLLAVARATIGVTVGCMLAAMGYGATGVLVGTLAGYLLPTYVLARREWRGASSARSDKALSAEMFRLGFPIAITFALTFVTSASDRYVLAYFMNMDTVGQYAVAYDFTQQILGILMAVVTTAGLPLVLNAFEKEGVEAANERLTSQVVLLAAVSIPAAAGLAALGPSLAQVILGEGFGESARLIIPVVALAILIGGFKSFWFDLSFILARRTGIQVAIAAVMGVVSLSCNVLLVGRWGVVGAAWAAVAAYSTGACLSTILGGRVYELPVPIQDILKIVVSSAAMVVCVVVVEPVSTLALASTILLGVCVYSTGILVLNVGGIRASFPDVVRRR